MANEIVNKDWFVKANEIVKAMPIEEVVYNYMLIDALEDIKKESMREKIINSTINKLETTLPNGQKKVLTVSRGGTTTKVVPVTKIDYDKAINFAKENGFELPMTERVVIEPQVDLNKIESMIWFQNNVEKFVTKIEETKTTKSFDKILIKDIKEE